MSKIIVIDGLDGSGKATQSNILKQNLIKDGFSVKQISFPNYESRSSELVKFYLEGKISKNPNEVNPYAAACFYACDRYINYKTDWINDINNKTIIIADRYVSSNAIHQMVKLEKNEWLNFLNWLFDFEYKKLGLPKEDYLIYLDMDPNISKHLLNNRYKNSGEKDIHELNVDYLMNCRKAAKFAAQLNNWDIIKCFDDNNPLNINYISEIIYKKVREKIYT